LLNFRHISALLPCEQKQPRLLMEAGQKYGEKKTPKAARGLKPGAV
jgi:hypothetical protein